MKKNPKVIIEKPKQVQITPAQRRLFDAANKRIDHIAKHNASTGDSLKQTDIISFKNSARAITGHKGGHLSKSKTMSEQQLKSQILLAKKVLADDTLTVTGAKKEQQTQRDAWIDNLETSYPDLERDDLEEIYDALIEYNQEHYEDSYLQWLYESWKESDHSEKEHGLMQILSAGKAHNMSVKESMEWLAEHSQNQTWSSLANKYLKQW